MRAPCCSHYRQGGRFVASKFEQYNTDKMEEQVREGLEHVVRELEFFGPAKFSDKIIVLLPDNAPAHHTFVKGYADPRHMNLKKVSQTAYTMNGWYIDSNGKKVEQVRRASVGGCRQSRCLTLPLAGDRQSLSQGRHD